MKNKTRLIGIIAIIAFIGLAPTACKNPSKDASTPSEVETPTANPPAGTYASAQTVTLASATGGASIYYTLNGTEPTAASTLYSGGIPISAATTLKAIAVKSGMTDSGVLTAVYTITDPLLETVATPSATPPAGTYTSAQTVTLASATAEASIFYTIDGTEPTAASTLYSASITISQTATLKAIAIKSGMNASAVLTAVYTIDLPTPDTWMEYVTTVNTSAPVYGFVLPSGDTFANYDRVTVRIKTDTTATGRLRAYGVYNKSLFQFPVTQQNAPDMGNAADNKLLTDPGIDSFSHNGTWQSYTLTLGTAAKTAQASSSGLLIIAVGVVPPSGEANPPGSSRSYYIKDIVLTNAAGTKSVSALRPDDPQLWGVTGVGAFVTAWSSGTVTREIQAGELETVATPSATPPAGTYTSAQTVTLASATPGATIYYTTNNSTPTTNSTQYTTGPITISATTTLRAIAVKSGMNNSSEFSATYTISLPPVDTWIEHVTTNGLSAPVYGFVLPQGDTFANYDRITMRIKTDTATSGRLRAFGAYAKSSFTFPITQANAPDMGNAADNKLLTDPGVDNFSQNGTWQSYSLTLATAAKTAQASSNGLLIIAVGIVPPQGSNDGSRTYYIADIALTNAAGTKSVSALRPDDAQLWGATGVGAFVTASYARNTADREIQPDPDKETVVMPVAGPGAGTYQSAQTVTLSTTTGGANIYYTLNGTTPNTASKLYTGPFTIGVSTTLKAIAAKDGMNNSTVLIAAYTINSYLHTRWPFKVGAAAPGSAFTTTNPQYPLLKQFEVLVAENDMKPDAVMPTSKPANYNTSTNQGSGYRWTNADRLVTYAEANNTGIRGHVLIWHAQTPAWFFTGTGVDGRATKAELYSNMETHIKTVFQKYGGRVGWWDVCNEVVSDGNNGTGWPRPGGDPNSGGSRYTQIMEDSGLTGIDRYEFVLKAFQWARQYADANGGANVKLFLTDYNTEMDGWGKQAAFELLVDYLIANNAPIDGVGFQTHIRFDTPLVTDISNSIVKFSNKTKTGGVKLMTQVCELDISVFTSLEAEAGGTLPSNVLPGRLTLLATKYRDLFDMFKLRYDEGRIDMVLVWGLADGESWLNFRSPPRTDHPLLFDRDYQPKEAYNRLVE